MEVQQSKSLKRKIFIGTIDVAVILLLIVGGLNYILFSSGISSFYRQTVEIGAVTASSVMDADDVQFLADEVWKTIEQTGERSDENHAFDYLRETEQYIETINLLNRIRGAQNSAFTTLVLADTANMRFIYLADADAAGFTSNHVSFPGDCYKMSESEKNYILDNEYSIPTYTYNYQERDKTVLLYSAGNAVLDTHGKVIAFVITDIRMEDITHEIWPRLLQNLIIMAGVVFLLAFIVTVLGNTYLIDPLNKLSTAARAFINNRKNQKHNDVSYFKALGIRTQDEIEQLARSMSAMEKDLYAYENEIVSLTKDKERIRTELSLARNIQHDTLPTSFPPFPEREEIDIHAFIRPAREVGGDFYDFFMIDEDHLGLVVADVSGKGIPAALFMMIAKILISISLKSTLSPAKALDIVNKLLCENNKEQMFVTVWLAIVDLNTGLVTYANAGHENPLLYQNGKWSYILTKHGLVLSALEDVNYSEHTLQLQEGDWLFQYSDGIPEAANKDNELFGDERLLESCRQADMSSTESLLKGIQNDIDEFVGEAEQFDDITMLAYRYHKKEG